MDQFDQVSDCRSLGRSVCFNDKVGGKKAAEALKADGQQFSATGAQDKAFIIMQRSSEDCLERDTETFLLFHGNVGKLLAQEDTCSCAKLLFSVQAHVFTSLTQLPLRSTSLERFKCVWINVRLMSGLMKSYAPSAQFSSQSVEAQRCSGLDLGWVCTWLLEKLILGWVAEADANRGGFPVVISPLHL